MNESYCRSAAVRAQKSKGLMAFDAVEGAIMGGCPNEDGFVLGKRGELFRLNLSASLIWEALAEPLTKAEIVRTLASAFDGDPDQIERSAESLLSSLENNQLIIRVASPAH